MVEAEKVKSTIEVLGECFAAGAAPAASCYPASTLSCEILPWRYKEETVLGIPTETVRDVGIYNLNWLEAFVNVYGAERFMKFADFCGEHLIRDLHDGNIGFMRKGEVEIPIILDWLSD